MRPTKHRITSEKEHAGDFLPYFDWHEGEQLFSLPPDLSLREMISDGCERWTERGGMIVRYCFGLETVNLRRDERDVLSGIYKANKYCCPLAPLLDGSPSNFHPLADAARLLQVDQFFIVGFMHAVDKTTLDVIGKRMDTFKEAPSYFEGESLGAEIAAKYIRIPGGWEV
jgi:hypothetical protein